MSSSIQKRPSNMGSSSPPHKKKRVSQSAIPNPKPKFVPRATMRTHSKRSEEKLAEKEVKKARVRAEKYKEFVQVIRVPFSLGSLEEALTKEEKDELEDICDNELGPRQEAQCISAKFVDVDGEPILFYFGNRVIEKNGQTKPEEIKLSQQYKNRTQGYWDSIEENGTASKIFDGLHHEKCERYQLAAQKLAHALKVKDLKDTGCRYGTREPMKYMEEETGVEKEEDTGSITIAHGWIQRAQKEKGLFISSDITNNSTAAASVQAYLYQTEDIAKALAVMFEAAFPKLYEEYQEAFDAGVWLQSDPGPFLARAIVYKLQSKLHKDGNDVGPSACFPVGKFEGGEMLFPQLKTKLR